MANQTPAGNWQVGAPGSLKRLEQEAEEAHARGDYYTWGKVQAEIDRLYIESRMKPIDGCNCHTCKRLRSEQGATMLPVLAVLTAFTVAAVLIAQSGLLSAVLARLAEVR